MILWMHRLQPPIRQQIFAKQKNIRYFAHVSLPKSETKTNHFLCIIDNFGSMSWMTGTTLRRDSCVSCCRMLRVEYRRAVGMLIPTKHKRVRWRRARKHRVYMVLFAIKVSPWCDALLLLLRMQTASTRRSYDVCLCEYGGIHRVAPARREIFFTELRRCQRRSSKCACAWWSYHQFTVGVGGLAVRVCVFRTMMFNINIWHVSGIFANIMVNKTVGISTGILSEWWEWIRMDILEVCRRVELKCRDREHLCNSYI